MSPIQGSSFISSLIGIYWDFTKTKEVNLLRYKYLSKIYFYLVVLQTKIKPEEENIKPR
jgi:hypothetical protein